MYDNFFNSEKLCKIIDGKLAIHFPDDYRDMPKIKRQTVDLDHFKYIGFQNTRKYDVRNPKEKTVGFFRNDNGFKRVCHKPWKYIKWLMQYKQTLTPDASCYTDMSLEEQWHSTYVNRLVGKYWQKMGLIVIPTIACSDEYSYSFAFSGIEKGSTVAVSTIGTSKNEKLFMNGFKKMCEVIQPEVVICYCKPYYEMYNHTKIVFAEHEGAREARKAKHKAPPNQLDFFYLLEEVN